VFIKILFGLSALLTIVSAIAATVTKDIMHSCIFLLGTLLGVAGLYASLGADFIAATQIMVYVGGVVILMLFAVMLTGGKNITPFPRNGESQSPLMGNTKTYAFGLVCAAIFLLSVYKLIGGVYEQSADSKIDSVSSTVDEIGMSLITDHVLAFEISSVLLLGALIGAAMIARTRKKVEGAND
jgi:NADH-quinone oxidoreductase subunit J